MKIEKENYIIGYVFKGKFFKSDDDMRGMTMSEDNKPTPVYNPEFVDGICMACETFSQRQRDCIRVVMDTLAPASDFKLF